MEVIRLEPSTRNHKKYVADVIIKGKLYKNVHFGDKRYQHYRDMTPLKLYSYLDHEDMARKRAFHSRHKNNNGPASMLAKEFLW